MFRENGTPRSRRQALDTSSSGTDSGIVLRSALLDEFRNGKARKWDLEARGVSMSHVYSR